MHGSSYDFLTFPLFTVGFAHLIRLNRVVTMLQELNIGGSIVVAALEEACGTKRSKIKELYDSLGDLGRKECLIKLLFSCCFVYGFPTNFGSLC